MESLLPNPLPPPSFFLRFGGQSNSFIPINKFGHGNDPIEFPSLSACFGHGNDQLEFPSISASHSCFATLTAKTGSSGVLARATTGGGGGGSLYDVLGVSPSATSDEIKSSYRKLALKYHPDVSKQANAQEKFIRIKNACDTLLDSDSRREYDYGRRTTSSHSASTKKKNYSNSHSASSSRKKNHSNHSKSAGRRRRTYYYYYYGTGGLRFTISKNLSESWTNGRRGTSSTSKHQSRKGTYDEDYYSSNETILWVWYLFHGLHSLH